jgi:predicted Zn-dependent protease
MEKTEAEQIFDKALNAATAEHTEALLHTEHGASTRFANNVITQNIEKRNSSLIVRSAFGNKCGRATTNEFTDDAIKRVVKKSEEIARASEPDTEFMPPLDPQEYKEVSAFDDGTAGFGPAQRAEAVGAGTKLCAKAGLSAAGSYATNADYVAVANSKGLFGYHKESSARYICTAMTEDSSGWAESWKVTAGEVESMEATHRAIEIAQKSRAPGEVEPGKYTVVLEPAAVAEMLIFMFMSMDAKAAHEGRSAFSGKEGSKIGIDSVNLLSRPDYPGCPGWPFQNDGLATPDLKWIDKGVVSNLMYQRFWAKKNGREPTGWPTNMILEGTEKTTEDLIASVDDGLLVTRFWYIRFVNPMTLLLTGMTRDGLFRINKGKVTGSVKHMRWNESPFNVLANVQMIGKPELTGDYIRCFIPPLLVKDFTFSSKTTF